MTISNPSLHRPVVSPQTFCSPIYRAPAGQLARAAQPHGRFRQPPLTPPRLKPQVFMRYRVSNRVTTFGPAGRWYERPALFSHVAVALLLALVTLNMLALVPVH